MGSKVNSDPVAYPEIALVVTGQSLGVHDEW